MHILIDYLVISFKMDKLDDIKKLLGLDDENITMIEIKSYYGYNKCIYYGGIKLHWNTTEVDAVSDCCIDMSGTGCRTVEQINDLKFDWFEFINYFDSMFRDKTAHISRIDIACDIYDDTLDYEQIKRYTTKRQYICRSKALPLVMSMQEESIYFGSSGSDRRLRIYDKALEQSISGKWLRLEFQLRNDNAMSYYLNWCEERDVGNLYRGVMIDYLRFVQLPEGTSVDTFRNNDHMDRLKTARFWSNFISGVERIKQLYLPGEEYTFERLENYIKKQTNSSVKAYLNALHGDVGSYLDMVSAAPLNINQIQLLERLSRRENKNET